MIVKCNKSLKDYDYLVMFDLASRVTGVCLWDIKNNKPVQTFTIVTNKKDGNFVSSLYENIRLLIENIKAEFGPGKIFISKEAMPTQLRGGSSTIQTFIALAEAHAILDLYAENFGVDVYDYTGVYPATTHAYLRKVLGLDSKASVDKKDIKKYVEENYDIKLKSLDESDAVFLALTLLNSKWNKDIDEEIKEVKEKKVKVKKDHKKLDNFLKKVDDNRWPIILFIVGFLLATLIFRCIFWPDRIATLKDGTQPVANIDGEPFTANDLYEVFGILNGTTNFILSKMTNEGLGYEEVLKEAQANGFAEANPTADVEGFDAAYKLSIL